MSASIPTPKRKVGRPATGKTKAKLGASIDTALHAKAKAAAIGKGESLSKFVSRALAAEILLGSSGIRYFSDGRSQWELNGSAITYISKEGERGESLLSSLEELLENPEVFETDEHGRRLAYKQGGDAP